MENGEITVRQLGEITNRLIQILAEHTGKGPTHGKSYINDDVVICLLRGALTPLEETLLAHGGGELVRQIRIELQRQMRDELMGAVARVAGRRVRDYNSQVLLDARILVEAFVLEG